MVSERASPEDNCFMCGEDNPNVLQRHRLVPPRYGGTDADENLVVLCANHRQAVEALYNDQFYDQLGVSSEDDVLDSKGDVRDRDEKIPDVVETGQPKSQRDRIKNLKQLIADLEDEYEDGAPVQEICIHSGDVGLVSRNVFKELSKLMKKGEVYEPRPGYLRTT